MYLKRKIDEFLINWKNDENHLPLIVKGLRQIGKTESINEFSKTYKNVVYINFTLEPIYKKIVNGGYDVICRGALLGINYKKIYMGILSTPKTRKKFEFLE